MVAAVMIIPSETLTIVLIPELSYMLVNPDERHRD